MRDVVVDDIETCGRHISGRFAWVLWYQIGYHMQSRFEAHPGVLLDMPYSVMSNEVNSVCPSIQNREWVVVILY